MPSETSLLKQQYYGHPRNAFWPIMGSLFSAVPELSYKQRKKILINARIAVWDVLESCHRPGSMDAKINMDSIKTNNFRRFFADHSSIMFVFFNGGKAEKIYKKFIVPELLGNYDYLQYQRLPSTSPAYAAMNLQQKLVAWQSVKQASVQSGE